MEAVEESRVDHRLREWGEEMTRLHQRIDRLVDIANEHHRGVGVDRITAISQAEALELDPHAASFLAKSRPMRIDTTDGATVGYQVAIPAQSDF